MGTWNATCGVTQLPILEGQRIAAIPLIVKQQDFLARDALTGSGAVENDLLAQPIAAAMFGTYHGSGCVEPDENDRGETLLQTLIESLLADGRLLSKETSHPEVMTELSEDWLFQLHRGELMVSVMNHRKQWLLQLKQTIDESDHKEGYSHYPPQLKEDPALLPDTFAVPLGVMFVPERLYHQLAQAAGAEKGDSSTSRIDTLRAWTTCSEEKRARAATLQEALIIMDDAETFGISGEVGGNKRRKTASTFMQSVIASKAVDIQSRYFYFPEAIEQVLEEALFKNDEEARSYWTTSMLFSDAMVLMRKQWAVQAGAGSSAGFEYSLALYRATAEFMAAALPAKA